MPLTTTGDMSPSTPPSLPSPPDQQRRKHLAPNINTSGGTGTNVPNNTSSVTLPLNLVSATNQQKKVVPNIKQQLPLKLATKLGGGSSPSPPTSLTSPTSSVVQMLPLKLSSSVSGADSMERRRAGGYTRLNSPGGSSGGTEQHSVPSHARTGSSPAMMQTIEVIEKGSGNKAGRTNTYPKLPEKFRISKSSTSNSNNSTNSNNQQQADEEVIFF
ncbi:uncharacterized protein LOC103512348 [Diaphorina citri]|uniref:Uncharacterized protein LOC103512348 n=1 Tax=Diaphorina citri TaxID=121845 RepID=A0A3Q0J404_DIACI|nr:uncharacterized protein LOC103512348 [Diaphorina citri]